MNKVVRIMAFGQSIEVKTIDTETNKDGTKRLTFFKTIRLPLNEFYIAGKPIVFLIRDANHKSRRLTQIKNARERRLATVQSHPTHYKNFLMIISRQSRNRQLAGAVNRAPSVLAWVSTHGTVLDPRNPLFDNTLFSGRPENNDDEQKIIHQKYITADHGISVWWVLLVSTGASLMICILVFMSLNSKIRGLIN